MAEEDAVAEATSAAEESPEKTDLKELKESAKEKLNDSKVNGNGNSEESISNGHDNNGNESKGEESEDGAKDNDDNDSDAKESNDKEEDEKMDTEDGGETVEEEEVDDEEKEEDDEVKEIDDEESNDKEEVDEVDEEMVENVDDDEEEIEDSEDVQEVKDDSDSDVMEVEAEDPLQASGNKSALTSTEVKKPQVVTIDDPKALQALASSAKSKARPEKDKVTIIDTSAILAGRSTSGVTITPAAKSKPKESLTNALASSLAASGVTISSRTNNTVTEKPSPRGPSPRGPSPRGSASPSPAGPAFTKVPGSNFVYDSKGQLQDPNLTDDTIVIEAPSFIVPYVYEKPPRETFELFKTEIQKLMAEIKAKAEEEKTKDKDEEDKDKEDKDKKKKKKKKVKKVKKKKSAEDKDGSGEEDNGEKSDDEDFEEEEESADSDDSDVQEIEDKSRPASPELPPVKKPSENFFESTLGKMVSDLGMNLVQEVVQHDLLKQQQRKARKDKSATVMHAIMSLKKNIEQSKENNDAFRFEEKKCRLCSFRTESDMVMAHHLETPHMKHGMYRCNFCHFETKGPQEVITHMEGYHEVKARLERAPMIHQCPQCPMEDNMKVKVTRHKVGCDKRYRPERHLQPPHDWEPPAKIPKPPQYNQVRPGVSVLNRTAPNVRGALQQFNQQKQQPNLYSRMPALQFGPGGQRGPARPFFPNKMVNQRQMNLPAFGQVGRLAGNPSVTIQSISKTGGLKANNPSISITPVAGNQRSPVAGGLKPGAPAGSSGKDNFVICEICDGYIRDLEQLRNHMQFIHKVKIHPKMIHNRPPLNCQKCQFRFFTDQGLERHLLGSHGLVTASMQDLANKGQDQGRCPVCGKQFQWKLLNHVAKDHMKTLKPAHLSYKCTVCTATFGQYKLFENHVYSAHSAGRKTGGTPKPPIKQSPIAGRKMGGGKPPVKQPPTVAGRPLKVSDEITIIPQGKNTPLAKKVAPKASPAMTIVPKPKPKASPVKKKVDEVIDIDDEEEEIDDVEEEGEKKRNGNPSKRKMSSEDGPSEAKSSKSENNSTAEESGEEGIEEIRDDDE